METNIQTQHMVRCSLLSLIVAEPQIFKVAVLAKLNAFYWQGDIASAFRICGLAKEIALCGHVFIVTNMYCSVCL